MKKTILSLTVLSLFFFACEEENEVDVTAPTITLMDPVFGEAFDAGGDIHFEALFEDDVALATYNINIHNNFDGHTHGRVLSAFSYNQSFDLTGRTDDVHVDIPVPAEAIAGPYHFIVEAIDAAGNSTTFADGSTQEVEIWLHNEEMAHIHFTDANGMDVDEYDGVAGEPIMVYGDVHDEAGTLDHVKIMVGHMDEGHSDDHDHDHDHDHRILDGELFEQEFEVEGQSEVLLQDLLANSSIIVPQSEIDELEAGEHLYLIVRVEDADGNISRNYIELHFD